MHLDAQKHFQHFVTMLWSILTGISCPCSLASSFRSFLSALASLPEMLASIVPRNIVMQAPDMTSIASWPELARHAGYIGRLCIAQNDSQRFDAMLRSTLPITRAHAAFKAVCKVSPPLLLEGNADSALVMLIVP